MGRTAIRFVAAGAANDDRPILIPRSGISTWHASSCAPWQPNTLIKFTDQTVWADCNNYWIAWELLVCCQARDSLMKSAVLPQIFRMRHAMAIAPASERTVNRVNSISQICDIRFRPALGFDNWQTVHIRNERHLAHGVLENGEGLVHAVPVPRSCRHT